MSQNAPGSLDPTVEVLYNYESTSTRGHSVNVRPGERYSLVNDTNENWWYVAKETDIDDGFYLPRSYVKSVCEDPNDSFPNFRPRLTDPNDCLVDSNGQRKSQLFSSDGYKMLTSVTSAGDGSLRRNSRGPGFKLADPKRISKSIPVDLNFVHNIPDLAAQQAIAERLNLKDDPDEDSTLEVVTVVPRPRLSLIRHTSHLSKSGDEQQPISEDSQQQISVANQNGVDKSVWIADSAAENCYQNLEETRRRGRPPIPAPDESPIRVVQEDWGEYREASGRTYFYHRASGLSTWKPPRSMVLPNPKLSASKMSSGDDELDSSFSADDFEKVQDEMGSSFGAHSTEVFLESEMDDVPKETAPPPPPPASSSSPFADFSAKEDAESQPSSSLTTSSDSAGSVRGLGKSVVYVSNKAYGTHRDSQDVYAYSEDCASLATSPRRRGSSEIKEGDGSPAAEEMERTRNHPALRSFRQKRGNHYAAPIGVCDLRGAKISWLDASVTRRKHVFQLELIDGTIDLFNTDDNQEINSWYHAVRQSIVRLPQPDLYPSPFPDPSASGGRGHGRNPSFSSAAPSSPQRDTRDQPASPSGAKAGKKDKKKPSAPSPPQTSGSAPSEPHAESRATILEKLRRFFRTRPSIDSLKEKGIYQPEPVFGSSLFEICTREKQTVPRFLMVCTELIEEKGLAVDGLYRISGNLSQVQKIRCQVDQERYNLLISEDDVHVLTGALKLFFRELQDPLFPLSMTKEFLDAIKQQKQRRSVFRNLLGKMPRVHHDTLMHLLRHLLKVADRAAENRMQTHNLAIVFGPTLFSSAQAGPASSGQAKNNGKRRGQAPAQGNKPEPIQSNSHLAFNMIMQGQIVEYLLKEYPRLFPK